MKWYLAIIFTMVILAVTLVWSGLLGFDLTIFLVLGTAIWVAFDSKKIDLKKYKSGISYGPVVIFFAVAFLWIFGFPWYLHVRYKIKNGLAELKDLDDTGVANTS